MENYESFFSFLFFWLATGASGFGIGHTGSGSKPTAPETGGVKQDNQQWILVFCGEVTRF